MARGNELSRHSSAVGVPQGDDIAAGVTVPDGRGVSCPFRPSVTSPKYDMKTVYVNSNLGGRIWGRKGGDPQAGTSTLEGEIDQLVYQLYGLSEDEVKNVEGK